MIYHEEEKENKIDMNLVSAKIIDESLENMQNPLIELKNIDLHRLLQILYTLDSKYGKNEIQIYRDDRICIRVEDDVINISNTNI